MQIEPIELYTGMLSVYMPANAKPICVGFANGGDGIAIWFEMDRSIDQIDRRFQAFADFQPIPDNAKYIGSVIAPYLSRHVYELPA